MAGLSPQDGNGQEREAGVGERDQQPELDHLGQLLELRRAVRTG